MQKKIGFKILSLLTIFQIRFFRIKDQSMYPFLKDNQLVIVNTSKYSKRNIKHGDVVVFKVLGRKINFIKRVIGIPNDKITITSEGVEINEKDFFQHHISSNYELRSLYLLDGQYFVLADNRNISSMFDSRKIGTISLNDIVGKVVKTI
jgi:signal peptidase I|tara:strand:+ start:374 stop:820 length:447 start_codon:yes stop_codon:yes gene_type:complete